jgi:glycosyltransferase involved in cell wall biosynthesis
MGHRLSAPEGEDAPAAGRGALRLGVNLFALALGGGGMRQYVLQLLPGLLRHSPHDLVLFYAAQGQPSLAAMLRRLHPAERNRVLTVPIDDQEQIFRHAGAFDVYFCPLNALAPDFLDRPTLATLADVQEQFYPHYFTREQLDARAWLYPHTAHAVTTLLTISEFSKRSICAAFGVPPEKVRVTHLAPNDELLDTPAAWPAGLPQLPERYVFYPANLYPHKNHPALLRALRLLYDRGHDIRAVLTGQPAEPGTDLEAEAKAAGVQGRVLWLRHVPPAALRHLYEHALALCFPSRFEGFGMPLVEALRCGCPVIATPAASVPEVVGDAALLTDGSPEALADAVASLATDEGRRQELIARGRERAGQFQVRRLVEETLGAIEEAVTRFTAGRQRTADAGAVSYVVRSQTGGRALARTLASLSFEAHDHDEVLVLAAPEAVGVEARTLAANLGMARFVPPAERPDAWLDEARHDALCYLGEGDTLAEGATAAALGAFRARPEARAAVGQVLAAGPGGETAGVCYLPPLLTRPREDGPAPAAAVFWRRAFLCEHRGLLRRASLREQLGLPGGPSWPAEALRLAGDRAVSLWRTFAAVPAPNAKPTADAVGWRWRCVTVARAVARALAPRQGRLRRAGAGLVRRLPWLHAPLRGLYLRMAHPSQAPR